MDCDTTGIEPDFALVKFKKLAGGGYFKIINQSVPAALEALGYPSHQVAEIVAHAVGHGSIAQAPAINPTALVGHGFGPAEIEKIEAAMPSAFDIRFVFNQWTLGEEFCTGTLGIPAEKLADPGFDLLRHLGFTRAQIEAANDHVCGTMTLEGAPHLKDEHLLGLRLRQPLRQEGQALPVGRQPHPHDGGGAELHLGRDLQDHQHAQRRHDRATALRPTNSAWSLALKANALYRDGSKLSSRSPRR